MRYPKRPDTHIKESDSWKILQNTVPARWIIREVSERDYGIDCYVELVNNDGKVTGELLSVQLKGTEKIEWSETENKVKKSTFSGISIETIHYWMSLPVPVFLFVADLTDRNLYFAPVKNQVRSQYQKYLKQDSMSFKLTDTHKIDRDIGLVVLLAHYFEEKYHEKFVSHIRTLIVHWQHYLEFIQSMQQLDCFMGAEPDEELLFVHIYKTLYELSQLLSVKWENESLKDIIENDRKTWKDSYYMLHYQTFTDVLPSLEKIFFEIIDKTKNRLIEKEKEYWSVADPILYRMAQNLIHVKPGYTCY